MLGRSAGLSIRLNCSIRVDDDESVTQMMWVSHGINLCKCDSVYAKQHETSEGDQINIMFALAWRLRQCRATWWCQLKFLELFGKFILEVFIVVVVGAQKTMRNWIYDWNFIVENGIKWAMLDWVEHSAHHKTLVWPKVLSNSSTRLQLVQISSFNRRTCLKATSRCCESNEPPKKGS